jgi:hypothetical protein
MQDHQDQRHSRHSRAMAHGMANPQRCPLPLACQVLCRRVYQKAPLWPQKGMSVFRVVYSQQAYYIYYLHITITYYNYTIYVYIFIFIYLFSMYLIYTINFWTRVHTPASILGFHHKDLFDIILISTTKHIYIYILSLLIARCSRAKVLSLSRLHKIRNCSKYCYLAVLRISKGIASVFEMKVEMTGWWQDILCRKNQEDLGYG